MIKKEGNLTLQNSCRSRFEQQNWFELQSNSCEVYKAKVALDQMTVKGTNS